MVTEFFNISIEIIVFCLLEWSEYNWNFPKWIKCYSPLTTHHSLFTFHFSLFTFHFSLFTLHSSLFTLHSSLFTLHFHQVKFGKSFELTASYFLFASLRFLLQFFLNVNHPLFRIISILKNSGSRTHTCLKEEIPIFSLNQFSSRWFFTVQRQWSGCVLFQFRLY